MLEARASPRRPHLDQRLARRAARSRRLVGPWRRRQSARAVVRQARRPAGRVAGRPPADRRAREGQDARGPAQARGPRPRGVQHRDGVGELEEQGDDPVEGPALDFGQGGGRSVAARLMAAGNRQAGDRDLRRRQRGRAGRALRSDRGRGVVADRSARAQRPAKGGYASLVDDAARQLCIRRSAASERVAWNDRGVTVVLRAGRRRGRPGCDRRAARSAARRPADARSAAAEEQQKAIGRIGYGAGILGKISLRFPHRFWPEQPKWFGRLPDSPDRRGTFNTWVSHVGETGLPILLSFSNGATAARLDRLASDEEVKEVAMSSLRKMFGNEARHPGRKRLAASGPTRHRVGLHPSSHR